MNASGAADELERHLFALLGCIDILAVIGTDLQREGRHLMQVVTLMRVLRRELMYIELIQLLLWAEATARVPQIVAPDGAASAEMSPVPNATRREE